MGWEFRHGGHLYLYRKRRVNGKPIKEYLAAKDRFGFGDLLADDLACLQRRQAKLRRLTRKARANYRARIDDLLGAAATTNADLRALAEGTLYALGFHKHKRGEWRMTRDLARLKDAIKELEKRGADPQPLINYSAPANDADAVALFAQARSGDADARVRVYSMVRDRKWADWLGDIGQEATHQLIQKASGGDPVWKAGLLQKANALQVELLGENPTVLEELLFRRVANGWIATHALELELTVRPPADARDRAHLDKALTRAQKRFTEAARELARIRQLRAPAILAQLNVAAAQTVVNTGTNAPTPTSTPIREANEDC